MIRIRLVSIFVIAILFIINSETRADNYEYKLTLGGALATFNTSMQVNSNLTTNNKYIDFEDDLGYDESVNFYNFSLDTKLTDNHRLYINISPFRRNTRNVISESIEFADDTLHVNTDIVSKLSNTIYDINYGYQFKTSENSEFEAIAGIYWMKTRFKINASGLIENQLGQINFDANYKKTRSAGIPLPLFGIGYRYYLNNEWTIVSSARYFSSSFNDIDGDISSFIISTEYVPSSNWGFGASLKFLDVNATLTKENFRGDMEWQYLGFNAYVFYNF